MIRWLDSPAGRSKDSTGTPKRGSTKYRSAWRGFETQLAKASELNRLIREAGNDSPRDELYAFFEEAEEAVACSRLLGHLTLAAFFRGTSTKKRKDLLKHLRDAVQRGEAREYLSWLRDLAGNGTTHFAPFHWDVEFPEVFERENAGFDAVVGNPPFAGKNSVAASNAVWVSGLAEELARGEPRQR